MRHIIVLLGILCLTNDSHAQNYGSLHKDRIGKAISSDIEFKEVRLFSKESKHSDSIVQLSQYYQPAVANINALYNNKPLSLSITLQTADGKTYTLKLLQSHPTSNDAKIDYVDQTGKHTTPHQVGLHYQGIVSGKNKSMAAMSVFDNGEVMLLFSCNDGNFNMGKLEDNSGRYVLYNTQDRLIELPFSCATPDTGAIDINGRAASKTTRAILCKKLRIHWEGDYTYYQSKGTLAAAQNYLIGLFNFMQSIYYNEGMAIEMTSLKIWTIDDPIISTSAWDASWLFGRYWTSQGYTFYGQQPHLIANFTGWQGFANIGGICFPSGYACSNISGQQSTTYPVFDLDVYLVSHETGHTIGSQHTQSCSWKTGPNGTCGSVDNCVTQEGGAGCSSCFYLHDANATNFKGTIMSYCGGKINLAEGFGTVVGDFMRTTFNNYTCLNDVISTDLETQNICNNDGAITLNYNSNNFGVAPYAYTWSNSQQTKDLTNLSTPGKYYVTIVDSNNCIGTDTAEIINHAKPGDGVALTGTMPYCCKDTLYDVTIKATTPSNLTPCQTVGWLRTSTPITSFADALTAYNNASSNDILLSDNDTSINNTTAAELTISSPTNCTSVTTYYYTPFVSRKPTPANTYTTNAINPVTIKNGNFNLGTSMTIPAEPGYPTGCEYNSPNITDTITVNISNYTGRLNKLSIRIVAADNQELYENIVLAGNGTYVIPITNTEDHFQEMTVKAFDFNCSSGNTCTNSSLNMSAVRKVTYHALPALTLDSSCVVGQSVLLSFGPDSCNNVGIDDIAQNFKNVTLHPNPSSKQTTLSFHAQKAGSTNIKAIDGMGRTVFEIDAEYQTGNNQIQLDINQLSSGVYYLHINEIRQPLKLVVM